MIDEHVYYNFILTQMHALIEQDIDPTFSQFQNTLHWKEIKSALPQSQLRSIIQTWDQMYRDMYKKAQSL